MNLKGSRRIKKLLVFILIFEAAFLCVLMTGADRSVFSFVTGTYAIAQEEKGAAEESSAEEQAGETEKAEEAETEADSSEETKKTLDGLEEKRQMLEKKEQAIREEEKRLQALKDTIEEKIQELSTLHKKINDSIAELERKKTEKELAAEAENERKLKQLVKVYSGMKPKLAGPSVNALDIEVAKEIFLRMKGEQAGAILSYVDSDKAARIIEAAAAKGKKIK